MRIEYTIDLSSYWHCSSGLSAGAEADMLVLKDDGQLPYIPGKTIKGLLKDAMIDIHEVQASQLALEDIQQIFGYEIKQKKVEEGANTRAGCAFFSDAVLDEETYREISINGLEYMLYKNISSTAIDKQTGTAQNHSLRTIEVCIPLQLQGYIDSGKIFNKDAIEMAFKWIHHLGTGRNRGLGRCRFFIKSSKL